MHEVTNYRPIAKLSPIPKLFENILYEDLSFKCKPFVSPRKHGSLKGRSTTTNLAEFVSFAFAVFENDKEIDDMATDFTKAFEKVSHKLIPFKMSALGFEPFVLK